MKHANAGSLADRLSVNGCAVNFQAGHGMARILRGILPFLQQYTETIFLAGLIIPISYFCRWLSGFSFSAVDVVVEIVMHILRQKPTK